MRLLPCLLACVTLIILVACGDSQKIKWSELRYDQNGADGTTCVETADNNCSTSAPSLLGHGVGTLNR
jgi:hypothetical protein